MTSSSDPTGSIRWLTRAAANAKRRGSPSEVFLDMLTAELHGYMPYDVARATAEGKVDRWLTSTES